MIHPFLQSSIAAYRATADRARETRLHSDLHASLLAADRLACLVEVLDYDVRPARTEAVPVVEAKPVRESVTSLIVEAIRELGDLATRRNIETWITCRGKVTTRNTVQTELHNLRQRGVIASDGAMRHCVYRLTETAHEAR